jgi:hypothetical protein
MARKRTSVVAPDMDAQKRFERRKAWFNMEWQRQEANRYQMALDEDYYDSLQWTEDEARQVRSRGQNPIVFNEVKYSIDFLLGTERRMRRDFKVLARNTSAKEASDDAEVKTKLLKYLDDVNRSPFERSQAFDDAVKAGLGWLETGITADPEQEPIYLSAESWRNMLHDSVSNERNPDKWRYQFRFKEIDLDVAQGYFPDKAEALERASNAGLDGGSDEGWTGIFPSMGLIGRANMPAKYIHYDNDMLITNPRKRVLLIECWSYEPTTETTGEGASATRRTKMKMHVSIMTKLETILEAPSPFKHNRFPFIPVWCYRRKRDGMPYGIVRPLRGPQDDLNKRMSKSLFEASSRQVRVEVGAIDEEAMGLEEIRDEENAPDGIPIYAKGALSGGKVQPVDRKGDAQAHMALAEIDRQALRMTVPMETRGSNSNVVAAKGIIAKQEASSMLTAEVFDNMLLAHQQEGELSTSLIEQFYTEEKTFSVTGERFKLDYVTINQQQPDGRKLNDVTRHKATFVIGEAPWRQSLAEAAFESAMQMLGQLAPVAPQVVVSIIDLVFEWSDLPNKQTILQRIRAATGMSDPDQGETPEQMEQKRKQALLAQAQFESELAGLKATIKEAMAKGEKLDAEAMAKRLETVYMSAQAAQVALQTPGAMVLADQLLESVGFDDRSGNGTGAVVPDQPAAPASMALQPNGQPPGQGGGAIPEPQQADGGMQGIETPGADGVIPQGAMQ